MLVSMQTTMAVMMMEMLAIAENTVLVRACGSTKATMTAILMAAMTGMQLGTASITIMAAMMQASATYGMTRWASGWSAAASTREGPGLRAHQCGSSWRAVLAVQEVQRGIRFSGSSAATMRRLQLLHQPRKERLMRPVQLQLQAQQMQRPEAPQLLVATALIRR